MSDTAAFEALAKILGPERLNAHAAEHHIAKDDPGWVGPLQMIPLLDAMRAERMKIEQASAVLPDRMNSAAGEILRGIRPQLEAVVRDIAVETGNATRDAVLAKVGGDMREMVTASAEHLGRTLRLHEGSVSAMQAGHEKHVGESIHASNQMRSVAAEVRQSWRDLQGHTFLIAIGICVVLVVASAGMSWKVAWDRAYHAGAYVERAAILHRAER